MPSTLMHSSVVQREVVEKPRTDWSVDSDEDSEGSTDLGTDDPEDDCSWSSSSSSSLPWARIVGFADEVPNGVLQEVIEIESFKEFTKFTAADKAQQEQEWCEKLLEEIDDGDGGIACLKGVVVELAVSACGYEVVQRAFEIARGEDQASLLSEMRGNIRHLAKSLYGAEVLQTCLELMRPATVSFIATELVGCAAKVACSEPGHAVLCRILEYMPVKLTAPLLDELTMSVPDLCRNPYAIQVVSHLMDYTSPHHQLRTCRMITMYEKVLNNNRLAIPLVRKAQLSLQTNGT